MNSEAYMALNASLVPTSSIFIVPAKWPTRLSISNVWCEIMISRDCRITKVTLTSSSNGRTSVVISHHKSSGAKAGFFSSIQINNQRGCLSIQDNMRLRWTQVPSFGIFRARTTLSFVGGADEHWNCGQSYRTIRHPRNDWCPSRWDQSDEAHIKCAWAWSQTHDQFVLLHQRVAQSSCSHHRCWKQ